MQKETIKVVTDDSTEIFVYSWLPDNGKEISGVIQIAHGMAEHAERYEDFASFMTEAGYAVYANDHRGHGQTAGSIDNLGFFSEKNGWDYVVSDMHKVTEKIKTSHNNKPLFLLGHSMGSLLSRDYISKFGSDINGVILSGTAGPAGVLGNIGICISKMESMLKGKKSPSGLMTALSFGSFNKAFKPNRTKFDWLSRDEAQVQKYIDDPMCGTVFSAQFFTDIIQGVKYISKLKNIKKTPKNLPVYIFSGSECPVGEKTKGVKKVYKLFKKAGIKDLSCKFYENGRHEMINEINKEEVYNDILGWITSHMN